MQITTATRRVFMSILSILLVFVTTVATTFAWVGILNYSELSEFELNLGVGESNNQYALAISAKEDGVYSDKADIVDIKRQILINRGVSSTNLVTEENVTKAFNRIELDAVTTADLKEFTQLNHENKTFESSKSYFKFDLYIKVNSNAEKVEDDINFNTGLTLSPEVNPIQGVRCASNIFNGITYPSKGIYENPGFAITSNNSYVEIDSSFATRFALEIYKPKSQLETYSESDKPVITKIYQGGTQLPSKLDTNYYSFGGILPEEYNLAYQEYKKMFDLGSEFMIPDKILNRNDLEITDETKALFDKSMSFGIKNGVSDKIKITVYFWYEGWDADCFAAIAGEQVSLNLVFRA